MFPACDVQLWRRFVLLEVANITKSNGALRSGGTGEVNPNQSYRLCASSIGITSNTRTSPTSSSMT